MQRFLTGLALPAMILLGAGAAWAQPTITNITPNYGGAGGNTSPTITGTGFFLEPKRVRFVDLNNDDVLTGIACTSSTTCLASGVRPFRAPAGTISVIQVYALVDGVKSTTHIGIYYYGKPVVSLTPSSGPLSPATPYVLSGGPFTSAAAGFPGTTSIYLNTSSHDFASGCTSGSSCSDTAPALTDCCVPQGAWMMLVSTPGGSVTPSFNYGAGTQTPPTPTVTAISASSGPLAGGNTVTITGTNFIPGTQAPQGVFGVNKGTTFTFISSSASNVATGVNCSSTTTCTMVAPGGTAGPVDIQVYTVCAANTAPCSGNTRPSRSVTTTAKGLYAFPGIKLTPNNAPIYVSENGATATFTIALYSQPTANVHIQLSTSGGGGSLSFPTADFSPTDWARPWSVTVTGLDNGSPAGSPSYDIVLTSSSTDPNYNGLSADQSFTSLGKDFKYFLVSPQSGLFTTRAGGYAAFNIVLTKAPSAPVTVHVASNDSAAGTVSPGTLTFATTQGGTTGWDVPQPVFVTGHNDGMAGTNRDYSIVLTSTSADSGYNLSNPNLPDLTVTNVDALPAPTGLSAVRGAGPSVKLSWTAVAAADYYLLKFGTTPGGPMNLIGSTAFTSLELPGFPAGQQNYFVVSAVNGAGQSVNSAEEPFKTLPPAPVGAFDTDSKSEMTYYKANGDWKMLNSIGGYASSTTVSLGGAGYTPVPGDYDGDERQDVAVYNGVTGAWNILKSSSGFTTALNVNWGGAGYVPVPGDYDGDGKTDPAVYRLSDGQWSVLTSGSNYTSTIVVNWGGSGYTPVPGLDFDRDLRADIAVYQQSTGSWFVLKSITNYTTVITKNWGGVGYTLVPGDYDGDKKADMGLYQRSTGTWSILLSRVGFTTAINVNWGGPGYLPVPGDYDGDGKIDLGLFQQSTGNWYVLLSSTGYTTTLSTTAWGTNADRPISSAIAVGGDDASRASDVDADGKAEITVYNPTSGALSSLTSSSGYAAAVNKTFGGTGYTAVPGDYDGDGKVDYGVYNIATGMWSVLMSASNYTTVLLMGAGGPGWIPVPGDYDGDRKTDFVAYNVTTGQWRGLKSSSDYTTSVLISYGGTGYTAVPADFDGDGRTDIAVYQQSTGNWSVLLSSSNYTTSLSKSVGGAGYVPVQGDYDGDGKADFVTYNTTTGLWYGLKSSSNYTTTVNVNWGGTGYTPVKGDFDGDGKTDLGTYVASSGTFYVLLSGSNYTTTLSRAFGGAGVIAVPAYP